MRIGLLIWALILSISVAFAQTSTLPENPLGYIPTGQTSLITCLQSQGYVQCINQANANLIINPSMEVDQPNEGAAVTCTGATCGPLNSIDGWKFNIASGPTGSNTLARASATPPTGFSNYLHFVTGTTAATVAGTFVTIYQPIEANNITNLNFGTANAAVMCLSWNSRSSVASYYWSIAIQNAAATRSYIAPVSESTANTWMNHAICFDGDQAGTWVTTGTAEGLRINFVLQCGSTFQATDGNPRFWKAANNLCANNATPGVLGTAQTFDITGVKLEFVPNGWPLAPTSYVRNPVGLDLINAQRYYAKTFPQGTAPAQSGGLAGCLAVIAPNTTAGGFGIFWEFPAVMRANPTVTTYNPSAANANWRDITTVGTVPTAAVDTSTASISPNGIMIRSTTTGANAIGDNLCIQASADARL